MDHHYLPQFYLRSFAASNGRLLRYSRTPVGTVLAEWCAPRSTAFEPDLYAFAEARSHRERHSLEIDVLGVIDNAAATVFAKLRKPLLPVVELDERDRAAWASFLASLPTRHFARLLRWDSQTPAIVARAVGHLFATCTDTESKARAKRIVAANDFVSMAQSVPRT